MNWIITRKLGPVTKYRTETGRLTLYRSSAYWHPDANAALAAAHEGDIIVPALEPVQREPLKVED